MHERAGTGEVLQPAQVNGHSGSGDGTRGAGGESGSKG